MDADQDVVVKATVIDASIEATEESSAQLPAAREDVWQQWGALRPPYDPTFLCELVERSAALPPNIDAYATNICGFGYRLEPVIKLENNARLRTEVRDCIMMERLWTHGLSGAAEAFVVSDEEVDLKIAEIRNDMELERLFLTVFLDQCTPLRSLTKLRKETRRDMETTGNAYWEILRDRTGAIRRFVQSPSHATRLMPLDQTVSEFDEPQRISSIAYRDQTVRRRRRRFVQYIQGQEVVYFKELGDRRIMSARTGAYYTSESAMLAKEPNARPATEMWHFKIDSTIYAYGVPRWIGAFLSVLGSREADQINYDYFDNKAVPPLAILVSGGKLANEARQKIETFVRDHLKGSQNFHKILVLEASGQAAMPGQTPPTVTIKIVPLREAQQDDGLFLKYDERNFDKIGGQFRLPKLLRGETRDFNRSTAGEAVSYAEQQVFQPERLDEDDFFNRICFPSLGVRYWRFVTNSSATKDPPEQAKMLEAMAKWLTSGELRDLSADLLNQELPQIKDEWTRVPPDFWLASMRSGGGIGAAPPDPSSADGAAAPAAAAPMDAGDAARAVLLELQEVRRKLVELQSQRDVDALKAERPVEVLKVPDAEFASWVVADE